MGEGVAVMKMSEFDSLSTTSEGASKISVLMREYAELKGVGIMDIAVRNISGNARFYVHKRPIPTNND
jgi:hypothetical protein